MPTKPVIVATSVPDKPAEPLAMVNKLAFPSLGETRPSRPRKRFFGRFQTPHW
jgi:hypothetical protein